MGKLSSRNDLLKRSSSKVKFDKVQGAIKYLLSLSDEEFKMCAGDLSEKDKKRLIDKLSNIKTTNNDLEEFIKLCIDKFGTDKAIICLEGKNWGVQPIKTDEKGTITDISSGIAYYRASS